MLPHLLAIASGNPAALAVAPPASAETPSYWHSLSRGDRTGSITITTTATLGAGTINNLIDGALASNSTDSTWFNAGQGTREVKVDLGTAKIVDGFMWEQDATTSHGTWVFEGSNDDSSYTGIGGSFTLGGALLSINHFTNTTAYRYYKLRQTSGTTASTPWLREIYFRVADSGSAARDAYEQGARTGTITTTTTATMGSGSTINNLVDGDYAANSTGSAVFSAESTREIKFALGAGKIFTAFQWVQSNSVSHGTWVFEGSNDDASYTGLGSSFTLGLIPFQEVTFSNSTSYTYYKLRQTSGTTSSSPWLVETFFRVA